MIGASHLAYIILQIMYCDEMQRQYLLECLHDQPPDGIRLTKDERKARQLAAKVAEIVFTETD